MAKDESVWARRQREQEEEEREKAEEAAKAIERGETGRVADPTLLKRFEDIVQRAPILLDQLEHLYRQYAVGVLVRPPVEERSRLDQMMTHLVNLPKPSAADRFRFSSVWTSYQTHKSRWDKLLSDIESGKIKRVAKRD